MIEPELKAQYDRAAQNHQFYALREVIARKMHLLEALQRAQARGGWDVSPDIEYSIKAVENEIAYIRSLLPKLN